jgi:hypothetical protein
LTKEPSPVTAAYANDRANNLQANSGTKWQRNSTPRSNAWQNVAIGDANGTCLGDGQTSKHVKSSKQSPACSPRTGTAAKEPCVVNQKPTTVAESTKKDCSKPDKYVENGNIHTYVIMLLH